MKFNITSKTVKEEEAEYRQVAYGGRSYYNDTPYFEGWRDASTTFFQHILQSIFAVNEKKISDTSIVFLKYGTFLFCGIPKELSCIKQSNTNSYLGEVLSYEPSLYSSSSSIRWGGNIRGKICSKFKFKTMTLKDKDVGNPIRGLIDSFCDLPTLKSILADNVMLEENVSNSCKDFVEYKVNRPS
jgi:hypothetical protein